MDVRGKVENEKRREEMAEYIKKDELLKFKADVYDEDGHVLYAVPTGCIVAMPPEDVVLVRHGRWEEMHYEGGILDGTNFDRCSVCGYERVLDDPALKIRTVLALHRRGLHFAHRRGDVGNDACVVYRVSTL